MSPSYSNLTLPASAGGVLESPFSKDLGAAHGLQRMALGEDARAARARAALEWTHLELEPLVDIGAVARAILRNHAATARFRRATSPETLARQPAAWLGAHQPRTNLLAVGVSPLIADKETPQRSRHRRRGLTCR